MSYALRFVAMCQLIGFAASFRVCAGPRAAAGLTTRGRLPSCGLFGDGVPATVGEAKDRFNAAYGRPVSGVQQGFVNEMLTGCQVAMVSPAYKTSRVFSLGFESLCTAFLGGMSSNERETLRKALCAGVGLNAKQVKQEADALTSLAQGKTETELLASDDLKQIAGARDFKCAATGWIPRPCSDPDVTEASKVASSRRP